DAADVDPVAGRSGAHGLVDMAGADIVRHPPGPGGQAALPAKTGEAAPEMQVDVLFQVLPQSRVLLINGGQARNGGTMPVGNAAILRFAFGLLGHASPLCSAHRNNSRGGNGFLTKTIA